MGIDSETIEAVLANQGIRLAPGRAERIAPVLSASLDAASAQPLELEFETVPARYARALQRCKA